MTNKMTSERLFEAEKEKTATRIKGWYGRDTSDILFQYGKTLYHVHSTIHSMDSDSVSKLTTKNPEDVEYDFSNVQYFEV